MPILTYAVLRQDRREFIALTGITLGAFQSLLPAFLKSYERRYPSTVTMTGTQRQRDAGGGRKGLLDASEQKLLFALVYQRNRPTQELLGAAFGLSQTRAHRWIGQLLPVLQQACKDLNRYSESNLCGSASQESQTTRLSGMFIEGVQRRHHGLKTLEEYARYYRRRKKNYCDKYIVPGNGNLIDDLEQAQVEKMVEVRLR